MCNDFRIDYRYFHIVQTIFFYLINRHDDLYIGEAIYVTILELIAYRANYFLFSKNRLYDFYIGEAIYVTILELIVYRANYFFFI